MSGNPIRPARSDFGPKPVNVEPITDPEQQFDAEWGDLLLWQVSGNGLTADMAWVTCSSAGARLLNAEAWNPEGDQAPPTCARVSTGLYTVTYAATYNDKDGVARTTNLRAGKVSPMGTAFRVGVASVAGDNRTVTVSIFIDAATPADSAFLLELK